MTDHTSVTSGLPEWLGISDVAEYFGVSEWTVRNWVRNYEIAHVKIGRELKFTRAGVAEFIEARTRRPGGSRRIPDGEDAGSPTRAAS
jgi:excisionase family DNA binding protein